MEQSSDEMLVKVLVGVLVPVRYPQMATPPELVQLPDAPTECSHHHAYA